MPKHTFKLSGNPNDITSPAIKIKKRKKAKKGTVIIDDVLSSNIKIIEINNKKLLNRLSGEKDKSEIEKLKKKISENIKVIENFKQKKQKPLTPLKEILTSIVSPSSKKDMVQLNRDLNSANGINNISIIENGSQVEIKTEKDFYRSDLHGNEISHPQITQLHQGIFAHISVMVGNSFSFENTKNATLFPFEANSREIEIGNDILGNLGNSDNVFKYVKNDNVYTMTGTCTFYAIDVIVENQVYSMFKNKNNEWILMDSKRISQEIEKHLVDPLRTKIELNDKLLKNSNLTDNQIKSIEAETKKLQDEIEVNRKLGVQSFAKKMGYQSLVSYNFEASIDASKDPKEELDSSFKLQVETHVPELQYTGPNEKALKKANIEYSTDAPKKVGKLDKLGRALKELERNLGTIPGDRPKVVAIRAENPKAEVPAPLVFSERHNHANGPSLGDETRPPAPDKHPAKKKR